MDKALNLGLQNFEFNNCSTNVRHGLRSWVDYNQTFLLRTWTPFSLYQYIVDIFSGWRVTVTAAQSEVIFVFLLLALIVVGPRLWIIQRALAVWLSKKLYHYLPKFKSESPTTTKDTEDDDIQMIPKYDVEPGARLRLSRISGRESQINEDQALGNTQILKPKQPRLAERIKGGIMFSVLKVLDVIFSIGFSIVLVVFFVLLTVDFVQILDGQGHETQTHVIADSPACEFVPKHHRWDPLFSNKKMDMCSPVGSYLVANDERRRRYQNASCPFDDDACKSPTISGYSGKINVRKLGINVPGSYSMQVNATCGTIALKEELNVPLDKYNITLFQLLPDNFKSCGDPDHIVSRDSPNPYTGMLGLQVPLFERITWENCPQILGNEERQKASQLSSIVTVATVKHTPETVRNSSDLPLWANKAFACYHQAEFCFGGNNCSRIERGFKPETLQQIQSQILVSKEIPLNQSSLVESLIRVASAEFDVTLNPIGLLSNISEIDGPDHNLDEHFNHNILKSYVQHSMNRGLQTVPEILKDMARNSSLENGTEVSIPFAYREMCKMIKFSAGEWGSVYIVPYFGMLVFAISVAVGSITTHDGSLLAAVVLRAIWPIVGMFIPEEVLVLKIVLQKITAWVLLVSATISWKLMAYYRRWNGYSKVRLG